jgi:pyruvate formate lyase activating enzyme
MSSETKELREAKKMKLRLMSELLSTRTREGELYEKLEGDRVLCYSCGHRCRIADGLAGVCKVRFNRGGTLFVPWGYVAGLQCDPIEKKPFFHAMPGTDALSFGMLGCDFHCDYCFTGDTVVVTDRGPITFFEAFNSAERIERTLDGEIAFPLQLQAVTSSGNYRKVRAVFKHQYKGKLAVIRPYYLPELRCTPDHSVYATDDIAAPPQKIEAQRLTLKHYMAVPRHYSISSSNSLQIINAAEQLREHKIEYRIPWKLSEVDRQAIVAATLRGETSRQIGVAMGKDPSYIRHVRSKISRGLVNENKESGSIVENGFIRFPNEHRPGIPVAIPLNIDLAKLLGYYCAEGSIVRSKKRPNSYCLNFSFSHSESSLVEQVCDLLYRCFGIEAYQVERATTLAVAVSKASASLLLKSLAGRKATEKQVPQVLFDAPNYIAKAFLDAFVEGDGHRYKNGKVSITTVSNRLAYGISWLVLRLGYLPSIYETSMKEKAYIQGREVKRAPKQYTVVWYEDSIVDRKIVVTEEYYLVPVRSIESADYEGDVYNMEVEDEHNYLAGFLLVSNCQNWLTSQVLRDPDATAPAREVTAEQLLNIAEREKVSTITSTYNEPLITSEWAISIFRQAKERGFLTSYVSNGNGTPEVLDYIRPWVDLYKVDLKSFRDRHYRELGGLLTNVLDTIRGLKQRGFWVEIVTLIVPDFNDSLDELREMAEFLVSVDPFMPWHVTAFHTDYKMQDKGNTQASTLLKAVEIGAEAGLKYVYAGNAAGRVGKWESTWCHNCGELLIERSAYHILQIKLKNGKCHKCETEIPGVWKSPRYNIDDYHIDGNHGFVRAMRF